MSARRHPSEDKVVVSMGYPIKVTNRKREASVSWRRLNVERVACGATAPAQSETWPARYRSRLLNQPPPSGGQPRAASRHGAACPEAGREYMRARGTASAMARYGSARPPAKA